MIREASSSGTMDFRDGATWYRVTGEVGGGLAPLVVLHGGPGATHEYLLGLTSLADSGRAVIHYDQFGCGRSSHRRDWGAADWTVSLFLEELDALLAHLGVADRYHLLGQSWGGMLAAEHAVRAPSGLVSLTLSNSPASMGLWIQETGILRAQLPPEVIDTLDRHEADSTLDDDEYQEAVRVFYDRHVCRVPWPPYVARSFDALAEDPTVYHTMNGPTEFYCVGTLATWSVIERLSQVVAPTLVISGQHDEAAPACVEPYAQNIAGAKWEIVGHASHMPFVEQPAIYFDIVENFLRAHDEGTLDLRAL